VAAGDRCVHAFERAAYFVGSMAPIGDGSRLSSVCFARQLRIAPS
jgi:hypothetical protein